MPMPCSLQVPPLLPLHPPLRLELAQRRRRPARKAMLVKRVLQPLLRRWP